MNIELDLEGFKELESSLADLARESEVVHKAAVLAGANVLAKEINKEAPRSDEKGDHVHINEDIVAGNRVRKEDGEIYAVVGPTKETKHRVHLPEFGTIHQPANPFIERSMKNANERMLNAMREVIQAGHKL
jgi:HK97 gp10 family phage protein